MARTLLTVLCVCLVAPSLISGDQFDCESMEPLQRDSTRSILKRQNSVAPYSFTVNEAGPGEDVTVRLHSQSNGEEDLPHFGSFIIQARIPVRINMINATSPVGRFNAVDDSVFIKSCANASDTAVQANFLGRTEITVTWTPPENFRMIQLFATVVDMEGLYWDNVRSLLFDSKHPAPPGRSFSSSVAPSTTTTTTTTTTTVAPDHEAGEGGDQHGTDGEDKSPESHDDGETPATQPEQERPTGTGEDPKEGEKVAEQDRRASEVADGVIDEDLHNLDKEEELTAKWNEKKQHLIDDEEKYSEGDWQKAEEAERKAHETEVQMEMMEYERAKQLEEEARNARIRAEIRDKELHDRIEVPIDDSGENIVTGDETGSSGRACISLLALIAPIIALLL